MKTPELTPELQSWAKRIVNLAQDWGLSFYPIEFIPLSPEQINEMAALGGFPKRIPHWTNGMSFIDLQKKYEHGASKIYELVINTDPVYAYLMNTNPLVIQKLVMAHVTGHADFFYNNAWFKHTDKQMLHQMSNNASRVQRIIDKKGVKVVEDFIDVCYSLKNLIDPYKAHIKRDLIEDDEDAEDPPLTRIKTKDFMDRFINTEEYLEKQKQKLRLEKERKKEFPESPDRDVLGFLVKHAPLEKWQHAILAMIREESYYFAPQFMTKILNEGWASYVHSELMTRHLADTSDIFEYCSVHAGVVQNSGSLNPYRIGLHLLRDVKDRWDRGAFGKEYKECNNLEEKANWDKKLGLGKQKLLDIRKTHNDITFIDQFITPEFCIQEKLYAYKTSEELLNFDEISEEFIDIKNKLLGMLVNGGQPVIRVEDANYLNRGELLLGHQHDRKELDVKTAKHTLENMYKIWSRPVHIRTFLEGTELVWTYNGANHSTS